MEVLIDQNAGFCFGVVKAIDAAEQQLASNQSLYCLGDIVHNNAEVQRLANKGLAVIDYQQMDQLHDTRVLIRAHGEPPSTYAIAQRQHIELVDATCPIVLALQKRVREGYMEMQQVGGQVVIFGKQGHAEVIGLNGQTNNTAIIVSHPSDVDNVDFSRPIRLFSQTTKSKLEYQQLIDLMQQRATSDFVAYNTICNRVSNRSNELKAFAQSVDALIFVSGSNSSNGHYLYDVCRSVLPRTLFISSLDELDLDDPMLQGVQRVGVSGATSTPRWLMEAVAEKLKDHSNTLVRP